MISDVSDSLSSMYKRIGEMASGMGIGFERFNVTWIRHVLKSQGFRNPSIELRRKELDFQETVHPGSRVVEIDVYCADPYIFAEVTTYLRKEELQKVIYYTCLC